MGLGGDVGRVRRADVGLRHDEGRADLALEQRLQPLLLLGLVAVHFQHFHVAGVRRRAVEDLRRQPRPAHLLRQIRILDSVQAVAALGVRQEEVPKAFLLGFGLEAFEDLVHALGVLPAVGRLGDLGFVLDIERHDLVADHVLDAVVDRGDAVGHSKIHRRHVKLSLLVWFRGLKNGNRELGYPMVAGRAWPRQAEVLGCGSGYDSERADESDNGAS